MTLPALKPEPRFTYADYCSWPEGERWELIDGQAWNMCPAPSRQHQQIAGELFVQIKTALRGNPCQVFIAPFDVRLPEQGESDELTQTVVQPDLAIFCNPSRLDEKGGRGAPDWIIEVLSSSTAVKDQTVKRDLYARHGVAEYWLIHPTDRVLTIYRRTNQGFGPAQILAATGQISAESLGISIDWDQVFAEDILAAQ
ncbi:MAG: Uma2 family endonuclease [Gammaproteobacteria bacterium]|nr:Uma2 family endonuclease [Gammaproteobacteria bacterium]